jgi:hypothetical protein
VTDRSVTDGECVGEKVVKFGVRNGEIRVRGMPVSGTEGHRCLETCEGHAIGIDYFSSDDCDHGDSFENDSRVALLVRAAPGAAIFGTSCAGRLVQLNLPRQTQAVKPMMSARSSRNPGQVEIGMGR